MFAVLSSAAATSCDLQVGPADCGRLLELLALVPDPRKRRGIRHSVVAVLAIAAAAVLAGSKSVLAVGEWAAEAPHVVLGALGSRRSPRTGQFTAPHGADRLIELGTRLYDRAHQNGLVIDSDAIEESLQNL